MNVLIDTSIWSLVLRRPRPQTEPHALELLQLIDELRAEMIGPIRQEILSGVREWTQFEALRDTLRAFPDLDIRVEDYERAAEFFNLCRKKGIQGSNTDFLICAVAEGRNLAIFTTDEDFESYQAHIPIQLYVAREKHEDSSP
jgi:predicted nucleic acid-binding protein